MSTPIVASELFTTVMEAAGWRCECEGACGQPHRKTEGRCGRVHDGFSSKHGHRVRLMAAPVDPLTRPVAAAALPARELVAWCPECFTAAERAARRAVPAPAGMPGLFDLTELEGVQR